MNIFCHPRIPQCFVDINTLYFRRTLCHIGTVYMYICAVLRCESWDACITLSFSAIYKEFVTQLTELPPLPSLLFDLDVETVLQRLWAVCLKSELFNMFPHLNKSFLAAFQAWQARCISLSRDSFAEALEKGSKHLTVSRAHHGCQSQHLDHANLQGQKMFPILQKTEWINGGLQSQGPFCKCLRNTMLSTEREDSATKLCSTCCPKALWI